MEIKHPRRLIIVSPPQCNIVGIIKELTGSSPPVLVSASFAGQTHEWRVKTEYYSTTVPIWLDEITDLDTWKTEFEKPEAKEVIEAIGGWVYCFEKGTSRAASEEQEKLASNVEEAMKAIEGIIGTAAGYEWEGTKLAVALPRLRPATSQFMLDFAEWDDRCMQYGFEFVDADAVGKNEFGENVGLTRLKEALEANDWSAQAGDPNNEEDFGDFEAENAQMNAELWGLKASLLDPDTDYAEEDENEQDEASQVENLQRMMGEAMSIREEGSALPLEERKRFAARAVNAMMKDL